MALSDFNFILGSQSPRRNDILKMLDLTFTVDPRDTEEIYPENLPLDETAGYLARLKAGAYSPKDNEVVITADTVVIIDDELLGKPKDAEDAARTLRLLSGRTHKVMTGVCIKTATEEKSFQDKTLVTFNPLSEEEIAYYIENYSPYDKAGAYGIQEWIGAIAIHKFDGCYYNVVGLPAQKLYRALLEL